MRDKKQGSGIRDRGLGIRVQATGKRLCSLVPKPYSLFAIPFFVWVAFVFLPTHQMDVKWPGPFVPLANNGTWTLVQADEGDPSNESATCGTASATTCVIPLSQTTTAGNVLLLYGFTSNNVTISSISASSGSTGTFTHCSNCYQWNTTIGAAEDGGYVISAGTASTSITVTYSGATGQASIYLLELHFSGTSVSFDVSNSSQGSCSDHSLTGQALTLNGSNDAILQVENFDHGQASAISSPYNFLSSPVAVGFAYALSISSGSAPTWTTTGNNATTCESGAIAIQGSGAASGWIEIQEATNDGCTTSSSTCTIAWSQATTAGSTISVAMGEKGYSGTPSISTVWMCTSNPCTSDSSGGTWNTGLTGSPWYISGGSPTHSVDLAYETSNSGGLSYITVTRGNSGTPTFFGLTIVEIKWIGSGSVALDAIGNPNGGSNSCSSCTGSSFSSLSGTNDGMVQELDVDNTPSSPSSPYVLLTNPKNWLVCMGCTTTSAPTFTQSPAGQALVPALAFK